ncbi:MAG: LPXTG cell wall anchor domain-containing protein [Bryobacterales bacterium]|nr:LPXTG cell wall anchor domain-containing protein [Bryobacterales bacterium]
MNEPRVQALKQTPLKAQKPTQEEVEIAEVFAPPPQASTSASAQPKHLPKTGSPLPLIGLLGLLLLSGALGMRLVFARNQ